MLSFDIVIIVPERRVLFQVKSKTLWCEELYPKKLQRQRFHAYQLKQKCRYFNEFNDIGF